MNDFDQVEHEEIDLDSPSGWRSFFRYAKETYDETYNFFSELPQHKKDGGLIKDAKASLDELEELKDTAIGMLDKEEQITFNESEKAQELYDKLLGIRDEVESLVDAEEEVHGMEDVSVSVVDNQNDEQVPTHEEELLVQDDAVPETPHAIELDEIEAEVEPEPAPAAVDKEVDIESKVDEKVLEELDGLYEKVVTLSKEISEIENDFTDPTGDKKSTLIQLKISGKRAQDLREKLEAGSVPVTEQALSIVSREFLEIQKNVAGIKALVPHRDVEKEELVVKKNTGAMDIVVDNDGASSLAITVPKKKELAKIPEKEIVETKKINNSLTKKPEKKKQDLSSLHPRKESKKFIVLVPEEIREDAELSDLLSEHNLTWNHVERNLHKTIIEIEAPSKLDVFLKVNHGSLFRDLLKDMTLEQLSAFEHRKSEEIKNDLEKLTKEKGQQYTYESYRGWLSLFDEVSAAIPLEKSMTFGVLVAYLELIKLLPEEDVVS